MKSYRVRTVSVTKIYIIFILLLMASTIGAAYLLKAGYLNDILVMGMVFLPMMVLSLCFFYFWSDGYRDFKIGKDGIWAYGELIPWDSIDSYYVFDDAVLADDWGGFKAFTSFKIKLKTGKSVSISHRTRHDGTDDFIDLAREFENHILKFNKKHKENSILKKDVYPYSIRTKLGYVGVAIGVVILAIILVNLIN